ncbi:MAG: hypothetical protein R3E86_00790 [Pseudomonadales bacterium]
MRATTIILVLGLATGFVTANANAAAPPVAIPSFTVLGCTFNPANVPAFVNCVTSASTSAAEAAVTEAMSTAPNVARLPGEIEALNALRAINIEPFVACLNEANLSFGPIVGQLAQNPVAFAQARMTEMLGRAAALSADVFGSAPPVLQSGQLQAPTPQMINARIDRAISAIEQLAQQDPVAACAMPYVSGYAGQIRQSAAAFYPLMMNSAQQMVDDTLLPLLYQAMLPVLDTVLQGARSSAPGAATIPVTKAGTVPKDLDLAPGTSPARTPAPLQRTPTTPRTVSSPVTTKAASTPAPRTRAATTFARAAVQDAVVASVPEDVQRIALAEFTRRMLAPALLKTLTDETNSLADAIAAGTAAGFDTARLNQALNHAMVPDSAIALDVALETTRFYGHWMIDKVGGGLIDFTIGSAGAVEQIADQVVNGICSIGDIFGGIGCGVPTGVVSFLYVQIGLPIVSQGVTAGIHVSWEQMMSCASQALRAGQNPAAQSGACGPLGPMLADFPTQEQLIAYALPSVEATRSGLYAYQDAVRNLANAAARSQRR